MVIKDMQGFPTVVWFRQDLRLEDNPALQAAANRCAPIIPLYIWAPDEEGHWPLGGASRWWLHHSLMRLEENLSKLKLALVVRQGSSLSVIQDLIQETNAHAVFWNRRYEPYAIERDARVIEALHQQKIATQTFNGTLLFEPWTVATKQGQPFKVFTSFWKACLSMPSPEPPQLIPRNPIPFSRRLKSLGVDDLKLLPRIPWDVGIREYWTPGTAAAKKKLNHFLKNGIVQYQDNRDRPDLPGVSHLSPHLHFGEISSRMIWHALSKNDENSEKKGSYLRQLGWREFAYHLLYHFPQTPEQPLRKDFNAFTWKHDSSALRAWQKGMTGYPFVDAGMRQLWKIGWLHNRLRLIVGSFLVKDLLLSWVEGAKWFWDTLVDADLANNTLGWQWVGGCGADAAPYFRVFNPILQGKKFDPDGTYVRTWVPELMHLPNEWIHNPWEAPEMILKKAKVVLGATYPYPIVNHSIAKNEALTAYKARR